MNPSADAIGNLRVCFAEYYAASEEKRKTGIDKQQITGLYPGCMHRILDMIACANLRAQAGRLRAVDYMALQPDEIETSISHLNQIAIQSDPSFEQELIRITQYAQEQLKVKLPKFDRSCDGVDQISPAEAIIIIFEIAMDHFYKVRSPNPDSFQVNMGFPLTKQSPFYTPLRSNYDNDQALFKPTQTVNFHLKWFVRDMQIMPDKDVIAHWINCCKKMQIFAEKALPQALENSFKDYAGFCVFQREIRKHTLCLDLSALKRTLPS